MEGSMKNEIVVFNGGINNLIAPHLIQDNSCPYLANANISSGELIAEKESILDTTLPVEGQYATYFKAKKQIVSSKDDRFYIEWAGFLYWSNFVGDGTGKIQRYDGTDIVDLGNHIAPTLAPTLALDGTGLLKGDYSYTYTFLYDDVFETAPAPIVEIASVDNNAIKVSGIPTTGFTPAPTHVIIYRSGGLNPTFNKVDRIAYGITEYKDNTSDFKISRKELNTGTNDTPPADIDMLVESKGTLFGSVGDKIHFSKEGQPEYWSAYNYVQLPTPCTGLAVLGDNVIAFTEENMYVISGRNVQDVQVSKLPFQYGCRDKRSVQNIEGLVIWVTKLNEDDLLCSFNGSSVTILNTTNKRLASITVGNFTYNYFDEQTYDDFEVKFLNSTIIGRKYLLFLTGRTVVLDLELGGKTYYLDETVHGAFEYHNDTVVIKEDAPHSETYQAYRYVASNSARRNISMITKDYFDGSLVHDKEYRKITINGSGRWGIAVYIDDIQRFTFESKNGSTIYLPSGTHGKRISFSISSVGYAMIRAIAYEYEVLEDGYTTVPNPPIHKEHCEISFGGENGTAWYMAFKWNPNCPAFKKGN